MATLNFCRLIMGKKMKIGINLLLLHCRYFDESFKKYLLSGPVPNIYFLSKPFNLIGCHGNQKAKFAKNIKKSTPQKLY